MHGNFDLRFHSPYQRHVAPYVLICPCQLSFINWNWYLSLTTKLRPRPWSRHIPDLNRTQSTQGQSLLPFMHITFADTGIKSVPSPTFHLATGWLTPAVNKSALLRASVLSLPKRRKMALRHGTLDMMASVRQPVICTPNPTNPWCGHSDI